MTNTILNKMHEKEKKSDRRSVPVKAMRRNKTTVNFHRSKIDKADKSDLKSRKSLAPKKTLDDKKSKLNSTAVKTEGNEKKTNLTKSASKKDVLSKTMKKPLAKSKTLATLSPHRKGGLTPTKKGKKTEDKKEEKKDVKKKDDKKKEDKKDDKAKKEDKKKDEKKKDEKGKKEDKKKDDKGKKDDKAKKDDKGKKDDKAKKDDKGKKDDKAKKDDKGKKDDKAKKDDKGKKDKKVEKKDDKGKKDKKEEKKDEKKEEKKDEEKKTEEKKEDIKPEEKKTENNIEEKKEEVKKEENKEEKKDTEPPKETNPAPEEGKKEEAKPEEKKEEPKEESKEKKEEEAKPEEPKKEEIKPEETKITGKPKTVLIMKFLSEIDKCRPFLTDSDLLKISKISKEFSKNCLPKLKESNNQKMSKEEKELEDLNANSANLQNELTFNKLFSKSIENLKSKEDPDYLKKDEVPNEYVLLIYRILLQLINKEKEILKVKDNKEFWKLFKECIIKNSEKGLGAYIENEFKNLDFTEENIYKIYCLFEGKETKLDPAIISNMDKTAGLVIFSIKEALDFIGIHIGKNEKKPENVPYKKYLEYIINKRKENEQKLDKMISQL